MSGAPAETWRKFKFATASPWAFWLGGAIGAAATARRAQGYLPLTRASANSVRFVKRCFVVPLALMLLFWTGALAAATFGTGEAASAVAAYAGLSGTFFLVMAIGTFFLTARWGPGGKVMDQRPGAYDFIVELQRVHPKFAAAVREHQLARAASSATPAGFQSASMEVN